MLSSVFATISRCTLSDLGFLSVKICDISMPTSRCLWHFACPSCLSIFRSSAEKSSRKCMILVLPPPTCWLRPNVCTEWLLADFVLNIGKACVVGSAPQRICRFCRVWREFSGCCSCGSFCVFVVVVLCCMLRLFQVLQYLIYRRG